MAHFSNSRINTFLTCPLQYKYYYIDKIPKKTSIEGHLGTCVHNTLEYSYGIKDHKLTLEELLTYYETNWQTNWTDEIYIVKKKKKKEEYFETGKECLKNYFYSYDKDNTTTIALEKEINIQIGRYEFIGYIDRLALNQLGHLEIHDYKTGSKFPTEVEFKKDRQLALYQLAIQKEYPNQKIYLIWHYLQEKKKVTILKTSRELEKLKEEYLKLAQTIEKAVDFSPKKNFFCKWCSYQNICPIFNSPEEAHPQLDNNSTTIQQISLD